jgi:hypothetical protein
MKKSSLGCVTPLGLVTVLIVLLVTAGIAWARGGVLFSSGPLNAQAGAVLGNVSSHAELDGQCKSCHAPFWSGEKMADRCLDCHTKVAGELDDPSALHGILKSDYPQMDCRSCHTEHNGPEASLTFLELNTFPHELVGFSLAAHNTFSDGKPVQCADCHTEKLTVLDQQVCVDCHISLRPAIEEEHFAVFDIDCLACHDGVDTYGKAFDHTSTGFALVGEHMEAPCQGCHPGATTLEMLAAAPSGCYDCHQEEDAHRGNLGQDCGACHTPLSWKESIFDHTTTGYELLGQHNKIECSACHPNQNYEGTPETCFGCHEADNPHDALYGTDCSMCHTPTSWQDVQFDHTLMDTSDCQTCHVGDAPENHYPGQCSACHTTTAWLPVSFDHDVAGATDCQSCHIGDAPVNHYPGQCSACHTTSAWKPAFFDHSVAGATDCQSCHTRPANHYSGQCSLCHSTSSWAFVHSTGTDCQSCHTRPAGHYAGQCSACHSINAWRPASFNHSVAGASDCQSCHARPANHYSGQCSSCHSTSSWAFVHSAGTDCQACHRRPSEHPGGQCSQCHNTSSWEGAEGEGGDDD